MSRSSLRRWAGPAIAGSLALVGSILPVTVGTAHAAPGPDTAVFINEIHYDNAGADVDESVEIAGPVGTDLAGWRIVPYNGSGGVMYTPTVTLSGVIPEARVRAFPVAGLQNGSPDGLALVDASGALVQFLSYEGAFTATNGPAAGTTSTDIGVAEAGTETGQSLQLSGEGDSYGDFQWKAPAAQTPGAANTGQVFASTGAPLPPTVDCGPGVEATAGTAATSPVSATDPDSGIAALAITSPPVSGIALAGTTAPTGVGTAATATLTVAGTTAPGTYRVQLTATADDAAQATCTVVVTVTAPLTTSLVSTVQGSGLASPLAGQRVQVEAVVTSLITSRDVLDGFYVQEQDGDADTNAATSEGVYVFCRALCPTGLAGGDLVRVTGTVAEFNGTTQVDASTPGSTFAVVASGQPLPAAAVIDLPAAGSTEEVATFERYEGMRTTIRTTLAVAEYFSQAQYGEVVLEAGARSYQYTQTNAPSQEGYAAFLAALATRRIVLDDASNDQNDATTGTPDERYTFPTDGLSTTNRFRGGDTITGLTGVMEHNTAAGNWRLRPVVGQAYTFTSVNPRPKAPDAVGGRLQVASFNVLNYFADIDTTSSNNTGTCGPDGTDDCRGADSEAERVRQLDKIVAALSTIGADVFGLIEIQNDSGKATQQIVDALNASLEKQAPGTGTYAFIRTGTIGTDAIKQAFLYDTRTVRPVGEYDLLTAADDPRFLDTRNRPSLIQTFDEVRTGERFTVSVNHFKSKGSGCGADDDSPLDGSGNCDGTRTAAAQALVDHLADDPTGSGDPDFLIIGDLNSYAQERPITTIEGAGYTNLLQQFEGEDSYGYLFDGLLGDLDHALASESLLRQVTGAGGWDINADENPLFDYNDTVRDAGEAAFERESNVLPLYEADAYRSSDHDPAIVGLSLDTAPVADAGGPYTVKPGDSVVLDASASADLEGDALTFAWDLDGDGQFDDATGPRATFRANRPPGDYPVAVQVSDGDETSVDATVVSVVPPGHRSR